MERLAYLMKHTESEKAQVYAAVGPLDRAGARACAQPLITFDD
jgi:hypothetical protein